MESIEEQKFGTIIKKFNITKGTSDPDIEYYYDKATTPTVLLRKLVKDLELKIFETKAKINCIGDVANLINEIKVSHIEHRTSIHARTFKEVKLNWTKKIYNYVTLNFSL